MERFQSFLVWFSGCLAVALFILGALASPDRVLADGGCDCSQCPLLKCCETECSITDCSLCTTVDCEAQPKCNGLDQDCHAIEPDCTTLKYLCKYRTATGGLPCRCKA